MFRGRFAKVPHPIVIRAILYRFPSYALRRHFQGRVEIEFRAGYQTSGPENSTRCNRAVKSTRISVRLQHATPCCNRAVFSAPFSHCYFRVLVPSQTQRFVVGPEDPSSSTTVWQSRKIHEYAYTQKREAWDGILNSGASVICDDPARTISPRQHDECLSSGSRMKMYE